MLSEQLSQEETLDPADWSELRALGHRMVDDIFTYLETVRERYVWQPMPEKVQQAFNEPLPAEGRSAEAVYDEFCRNILPYPMGNIHPRFWGWVMGNNTPLAVLADMLASGINPNMGGGDHAPARVEAQVIAWCKEMFGFPPEASGLLLSGGSTANLVGLAVARHAKSGFDVREEGVSASPRPMTMYGSVEMHSSLQRAVEVLGLGNRSLRRIPVNQAFQIDVDSLRRSIEEDIASGCHPICLIANAGTVNTGAIDPLDALADIAAEYGMWYHVDGAFGALAYLSPAMRPALRGLERADSLAFDLHKWVYLPFEVGCTLVRDGEAQELPGVGRRGSANPCYRPPTPDPRPPMLGLAAGPRWFSDYGIQLTRGFRALKLWMAFKTYVIEKIGRVIHQNIWQAQYLASLVERHPKLELLAPVSLNVVCFRYAQPGLEGGQLDALNQELLIRLHESGVAVPSGTYIRGRYALRCAITNHRSHMEDFDVLAENVVRIGDALI